MPAAPGSSASAAQDSTPERRFTSEVLFTVARGASCQSLLPPEKPHPQALLRHMSSLFAGRFAAKTCQQAQPPKPSLAQDTVTALLSKGTKP